MIPTHIKHAVTRVVTLVVLGVVVLTLEGCSHRVADLTMVSTKNIDLSDIKLDMRTGKRVKGDDCKFSLLGLIPFGLPNLETAVDDALEKGKGNVMVDEVTEYRSYWFVIGGVSCIAVEGTVLTTKEAAIRPGPGT